MNKIVKIALGATLLLSLGATSVSADATKGQKLYKKKLKSACGMSGADIAAKHSQDEWDEANDNGLADEIRTICPSASDKALKGKFMKHYYDFFHEFANDSGNVPSC